MDCLDPPLLEIPQGDWYCDECFETDSEESEDDVNELEDLNHEIEDEFGELPGSRLRTRQQPQILRTMQSERIRNAILARMSLRSAREALGEGPSTSNAAAPASRRAYTRRRPARRARKRQTVVLEYDVRDGSDKFAMKTRKVSRRKTKKRRKKVVRAARRRKPMASSSAAAGASSFKSSNANVYELQRGRMAAGVSGFNIFEPTNQLDYVPDEEDNVVDSGIDEFGEGPGGLLTQTIISLNNPRRRNLLIKNRVLQNCTTTSSEPNLLDSIMQDQNMFGPGSLRDKFAVDKSNGRLVFVGKAAAGSAKTAAGGETSPAAEPQRSEPASSSAGSANTTTTNIQPSYSTSGTSFGNTSASDDNSINTIVDPQPSNIDESPPDKKKKPKRPAFDMFDENSNPEPTEECPNFSIYDSVEADQDASSSFQMRPNVYDEENVDLVQLSDNEVPVEETQPAIVASQPASPDLENDKVGELLPERSFTPPIVAKTSDDDRDKDDRDKDRKKKEKEKDARRDRKHELERYNVRDRLKERSPVKLKDRYGRNRSRSRSSPRSKRSRRRSPSPPRERRRRSRNRRSPSRSRSRRRTPSIDYDRKKKLHKEKAARSTRKSRSRSFTPKNLRPPTPDRRGRSRSKKAKKKKHRDYSKEKPSTLTKEVFTSGQNILVSVNFNNQEEKSSSKRLKSHERDEPKDIVDITARKKITISSKPVAIIDLARSPFRELTPEYQSNVIELSDSEGEKTGSKTEQLYDPFDILNSPSNENVTSSQNTAAQSAPSKQTKVLEPVKTNVTYNKNIMAMATSSLFFNEENLVSSSSSLMANEKLQPTIVPAAKLPEEHPVDKNATKHDLIPMDIAESPYSPGHEYDDSFPNDDAEHSPKTRHSKNKGMNIFDELFGSTTPPGLDRLKSKKSGKLGDLRCSGH